jgi:ElaB/YqjD/DUF883 family membrane-anchored ribosome-binding protein
VDQLRAQATVIGHDVQELGHIAKEAAHETLDVGRKRAQSLEKSFEEMIRENPVRSVLIAAGVGYAASIVLGRRWF